MINLFQKKSNLPIRIKATHSDSTVSGTIQVKWELSKSPTSNTLYANINKQTQQTINRFLKKNPTPFYGIELFFNNQWNKIEKFNILTTNEYLQFNQMKINKY